MKDHETAKVKLLKDQLFSEKERLENEIIRQMPLHDKVIAYVLVVIIFLVMLSVCVGIYGFILFFFWHQIPVFPFFPPR